VEIAVQSHQGYRSDIGTCWPLSRCKDSEGEITHWFRRMAEKADATDGMPPVGRRSSMAYHVQSKIYGKRLHHGCL
jgi:hypothetical protein